MVKKQMGGVGGDKEEVVLRQEFGGRSDTLEEGDHQGRSQPCLLGPSQPPASPPGKAGSPADVCQEFNGGHKPRRRRWSTTRTDCQASRGHENQPGSFFQRQHRRTEAALWFTFECI